MVVKRRINLIFKIIICIIILLLIFIYIFNKVNQKEKIVNNNLQEESNEVHILENNDMYTLKIDYHKYNIDVIDEAIENYVKMKKEEFLRSINENNSMKYDFILQVVSNEYNNILNIHMNTLSYTGGAHYVRDDNSLHYNMIEKKFVNLTDFFKDSASFSKIDDIVYYYLKKLDENHEYNFDDSWVRKGIAPNTANYSHFNLNEEGLEILFVPYQIAPWSSGEIKIIIPYDELNELLKEEYISEYHESEEENLIPEIRDLSKYEDKKLIAFTFDDGPNTSTTNILLDNLDKYDARVTFFVLGSRVDSHSEVLKRAYLMGNQIGSHTYSHKNLLLLENNEILNEINNTNDKIKEVIGVYPKIIRPPYGNTNENIKKISDLKTILWDVDTLDWKYRDANNVCNEILKSSHDGAIVLLHDIYKSSIDGALMAMDKLEDDGYAFVTIEEMAILKNRELDNEITYYNFK